MRVVTSIFSVEKHPLHRKYFPIFYNRHVKYWLSVIVSAFFLTGCGPDIQNKEAVKEGIVDHLKTRTDIDLSHMDVDVSSVSFREGEADATAVFKPKGSNEPGGSMSIGYTLEQKSGKWVVKGRKTGTAPAQGSHP